jgi:hypothetical protein
MAKKCAVRALIRLLPGFFGFGGFFLYQLFVTVIRGDQRMVRQLRRFPTQAKTKLEAHPTFSAADSPSLPVGPLR